MRKSSDKKPQNKTLKLLKQTKLKLAVAEERLTNLDQYIKQLESQVLTDTLTGLLNRRGLEIFYEQEQQRICRKHSPGALFVLIDFDRFKSINDVYGHPAGDACLRLFSQTMHNSVRILDGKARVGGDEFVLVLTQIETAASAQKLEKIRQTMNNLSLDWQGRKITFGASVGASVVTADSSYEDVYKMADEALYAHKELRHSALSALN